MDEIELKKASEALTLATKKAIEESKEKTELAIKEIEKNLLDHKTKSDKTDADFELLKKEHIEALEDLKALKEKAQKAKFKSELGEKIFENKSKFDDLKANRKPNIEFELKTVSVPGDIANREDAYFGFLDNTTTEKPVRNTFLLNLFKKVPIKNEYLKYREVDTITRDAKVVIACATSTHTSNKKWKVNTVHVQKVRDVADLCLDMSDDYGFVESEINELVNTNVLLKADQEIFNGSGDILSLNQVCSEFVPTNVLAPYNASFQAPTIGDLAGAMKAQIYTFGAENAWNADTIVMNYNDMIKYLHAKDANNNYLFPTFVFGNTNEINGLRIITNPLVAQNTCYVFDSTKGKILDRGKTLNTSYENRDNIEHETVTFVCFYRFQFHVKNIERDSFMKCSDIASALTAITKP